MNLGSLLSGFNVNIQEYSSLNITTFSSNTPMVTISTLPILQTGLINIQNLISSAGNNLTGFFNISGSGDINVLSTQNGIIIVLLD